MIEELRKKIKEKSENCWRCGVEEKEIRKKGYYEGCRVWGVYYRSHLFTINLLKD